MKLVTLILFSIFLLTDSAFAVIPKHCPKEIQLKYSNFNKYPEARLKDELGEKLYPQLQGAVQRLASAQVLELNLILISTPTGRCQYRHTYSNLVFGSADFFTKDGKDTLKVHFSTMLGQRNVDLILYSQVEKYTKTELVFSAGRGSPIYGTYYDGTRGDGNRFHRIGYANKLTTSSKNTVSINKLAEKLQALFLNGRHSFQRVEGETSLDLVKSYLVEQNLGDTKVLNNYEFLTDQKRLLVDESKAGTLIPQAAHEAIRINFNTLLLNENEDPTDTTLTLEQRQRKAQVAAIIVNFLAFDVVFGFDGFGQNGCASPTDFLLVIDEAGKAVYGVDLTPCRE